MAIDTAEKRRSLSGIQYSLIPGVTPNSAKDAEWRRESGWSYSAFAAAALTLVRKMRATVVQTLKLDAMRPW